MNEQQNGFLPLGSVVLLSGAKKRLMVTGYCAYDKGDQSKTYDYCGCLYPEGVISSSQMALFNHNQIEKVYFMGYTDEEDIKFKQNLYEALRELNSEK